MTLAIAGRAIDHAQPPYVIAELGVNHDGSADRALDLVRRAAHAGADAVKVQVFRADLLMSRASRLATYQSDAGETDPIQMLRRLELPLEALGEVAALAHSLGLAAIATVFSVELVDPASAIPFDAWKTASPDIVHQPLLEALARTGRPLIVSTGAATMDEVERCVAWLAEAGATRRLALLQCVSAYPTPPQHAALEGVDALRSRFAGHPIGYSDHTTGEQTGAQVVRHGAVILEKHFTYDTSAAGPDHAASLGPPSFRRYADAARDAWESRRPHPPPAPDPRARKALLDVERDVRLVSRQSIVAVRDLPPGHVLRPTDITFKRPGTGLEPFRVADILGRPLAAVAHRDQPLTPAHLLPMSLQPAAT